MQFAGKITPRSTDIALNHLLHPIGTKIILNAVLPLHNLVVEWWGQYHQLPLSNPLFVRRSPHLLGAFLDCGR